MIVENDKKISVNLIHKEHNSAENELEEESLNESESSELHEKDEE